MHRAPEARKDAEQVLHYEPRSAEAHYYLAEGHRLRGEILSERQELTDVIEINPAHLQARLNLAKLLTRQSPKAGRLPRAVLIESRAYGLFEAEFFRKVRYS